MQAIQAIIALVAVPLFFLNAGGGIVGGVWLLAIGEWREVVFGVLAGAIGVFAISLALMPGLMFLGPAAGLAEKRPALALPFLIVGQLWTYAVLTGWCVWIFHHYSQAA